MTGVWFGAGNLDPGNMRFVPLEGGEPPFTAQALTTYKNRQRAAEEGHPVRSPADECMPHGVPAVARLPTPIQIIQTPGQTTIIHEASRTVRLVYMDEKHPAQLEATFMGHSVGHWEGDTLVIDTIGMRENWLDISGAPASPQMHVVERYRKIDGGKLLEVRITIEDPHYYTRAWTARRVYGWYPSERVEEYICEEDREVEPGTVRGVFK